LLSLPIAFELRRRSLAEAHSLTEGGSQVVGAFQAPGAAAHLMNLQQPVDPLPQIGVLDRRHLAVPLPLPVVLAPVGQAKLQAALNVSAAGHQRHLRRLIERLEPADDGQQLQPLRASGMLVVGRLERCFAAGRF
jgi:hypothetical protein